MSNFAMVCIGHHKCVNKYILVDRIFHSTVNSFNNNTFKLTLL